MRTLPTNWTELSQTSPAELLDWAEAQSWAQAMVQCEQDPEWHAEGTVWKHTRWVVESALELSQGLESSQQRILLLAALFHDVAKPEVSTLEDGRIRSPKHCLIGSLRTRQILQKLGCPLEIRETIARLVRFHGRPTHFLEKESPENEVIYLSGLVPNDLLCRLALADNRGRISRSLDRPEELVDIFRTTAEQLNCLHQPYPFATVHSRFLFYQKSLPSLHYQPPEPKGPLVLLVSGLPGAGKDTWLRRHFPDLPVISLDQTRAELEIDPEENQGPVVSAAREKARILLRARTPFAFNATNVTAPVRSLWIRLFVDYGATIKAIYLEPSLEVIYPQNRNRPHPVPESILDRLIAKLEPPTIAEAHFVEYHS